MILNAKKPNPHLIFFLSFFLLILCNTALARAIVPDQSSAVLPDGASNVSSSEVIHISNAEAKACEQTYGFMPCTTTIMGNLFLILAYGYLMFCAARYLSAGSELLLEILGPGIIGGLFLPTLGALPDAMLILGMYQTH